MGLPQHVAHEVISKTVDLAKGGLKWQGAEILSDDILEGFTVSIRPVDQSYWPDYLNANIAFRNISGRPDISNVAQIVWPDGEGRFPWDAGFELSDRQHRLDIPNSIPGGVH